MLNSTIVVGAVLLSMGALYLRRMFTNCTTDPVEVLRKIESRYPKMEELFGHIDAEDEAAQDERIWEVIGRRKGLWVMSKDSITLVCMLHACGINRDDPTEMSVNAKRAETVLICNVGALGDAFFHWLGFDMGRNYARTAAKNYWKLLLSTQLLVQVYRPDLTEAVDAAL